MISKILEISKRATRGGRVPIKIALLKIHDIETDTNANGLHWDRGYVEGAMSSASGIPICAEFCDETKTSPLSHGYTGSEIDDGTEEPLFENSEVVGVIESASIETVQNGENSFEALVGTGVLYNQRYPKFVKWVRENFASGTVGTSIEIMGTAENENKIVYHESEPTSAFRTPEEFVFSGTAILSVSAADENATVLEIAEKKNKEEQGSMDDNELKTLIQTTIKESNDKTIELNEKISELNEQIIAKDNTITEQNATIEQVQAALKQMEDERQTWWEEKNLLEQELAKLKVEKRLAELNAMLGEYTEDERNYATSEINAFKEDPLNGDIESIKSKICVGIVGAQKSQAKVTEQNARTASNTEDIFSDMYTEKNSGGEVNIF